MPILPDHRSLPVAATPAPSQTRFARTIRYLAGAPLDGYARGDSTWLTPAAESFHRSGHLSRWHRAPGWQRTLVRIAGPAVAVGGPLEYVAHPTVTLTTLGLVCAGGCAHVGRKVHRRLMDRRHRRELVEPLLKSLRGPLGLPLNASAEKWLVVPKKPARVGQITRIWLPDEWLGEDVQKLMVTRLVTRWLNVPTEAVRWHLSSSPRFVEFAPVPQPAASVAWKPSDDPYTMHIGEDANGHDLHMETFTDNPHWCVVAGSGAGKTSTLTLPILHARQHGFLIDYIDLKRMSLLEPKPDSPNGIAGDPDQPSGIVSGIRIHTTIEGAIRALAEYLTSATAVALMQQQGMDTSHIPPRMLLTDEFGSFSGGAKAWWKGPGKTKVGKSPYVVPFWMLVCLQQGRALEHRMVLAAHQLALNLFGDAGTDARDLFSGRVLVGEASAERWITTFGRIKKPAWDGKVKGRGVYGTLGGAPTVFQAAYVPPQEANDILRSLPKAPLWFDAGESAPWLNEAYVREAEESYSAGRWVPGWSHLFETKKGSDELGDEIGDGPAIEMIASMQAATHVGHDRPDTAPVQAQPDHDAGPRPAVVIIRNEEDADRETLVSLREAAEQGITDATLGAMQMARKTSPAFPKSVGRRGVELLYSPTELEQWASSRSRSRAAGATG